MSEKVKLIIEIPQTTYKDLKAGKIYSSLCEAPQGLLEGIQNGIPLDDVKGEIETNLSWDMFDEYGNETRLHKELMEIFDSIGERDKE